MSIKTPYNLVPFDPKQVLYPKWAKAIQHDQAFENSLSGYIELKITNKTALFIAQGQLKAKKDRDPNQVLQFFTLNDKPALPATSLKGMIRNVLETLSFGKMPFVNDHTYAVRDFAPLSSYLSEFKKDNIRCGWLSKTKQGHYKLEDCGLPYRIHQDKISDELNLFARNIEENFRELEQEETQDLIRSARYKYEQFPKNSFLNEAEALSFTRIEHKNLKLVEPDPNGDLEGKIVFTGQPSPDKKYEFVFGECNQIIEKLPQNVVTNFIFNYAQAQREKPSIDWAFWFAKLENHEAIPVFFQLDKTGKIKHMGLSYLYKLKSPNSTRKLSQDPYLNSYPDLAECMFGYTFEQETKMQALKGRVHFGHAQLAPNSPCKIRNQAVELVLSSPKASYYPSYIKQELDASGKVKTYKTYMNENIEINGRKRYPVHTETKTFRQEPDQNIEKIKTLFQPLEAGAVFESKIYFHNLLEVELGALLSAISFHQTPDCYHSLGMAKPFGYGRVKLEITQICLQKHGQEETQKLKDYTPYLAAYENLMNQSFHGKWAEQAAIIELFSMVKISPNRLNDDLAYMPLIDFRNKKGDKSKSYALKKHSELRGQTSQLKLNQIGQAINLPTSISLARHDYLDELESRTQKAKEEQQKKLNKLRDDLKNELEKIRSEAIKKQQNEENNKQFNLDYQGGSLGELMKQLRLYTAKAKGFNDYEKFKKQNPDLLPPYLGQFVNEIQARLRLCYGKRGEANKKEQATWKNKAFWGQLGEIIGADLAQALEKECSN